MRAEDEDIGGPHGRVRSDGVRGLWLLPRLRRGRGPARLVTETSMAKPRWVECSVKLRKQFGLAHLKA